MSHQLTRRDFIHVATVTTAGLLGGVGSRHLFAQATDQPAEKPLYCFPLLGDIHYDLMTHHDMEWVQREKPNDIRQIEGYVRTTELYTPKLLEEIAQAVKSAEAPVPFVIQIGDFVEGLCGSFDLQALQFRDAMAAVEQAQLGAPFLISKGNHDITGPGAPEAYDQVLLPWLARQTQQELTSANFSLRHGEDRFLFFDAYRPDLDWLARELESDEARHNFFLIHPPVVPYNARANWHVFAHENQQAQRQRLLELLGRHRALVLSGHLHKYGLVTRQTDSGSFVQLAVNSVIRNDRETPRHDLRGLEAYNPDLLELEPRFAPETLERRRELLLAEAPFIRQFEYADVPGYAIVKVYADRVEADLYTGLGDIHWKSRALQPDGQQQVLRPPLGRPAPSRA